MKRKHERPVDLARVRAAEARLDTLLTRHPEARERTAAMLAGELACPDLAQESPMPPAQTPLNLRVPPAWLERADALVPRAQAAPELATVTTVTRSDVLRLALLRGLADLERELAQEGEGES